MRPILAVTINYIYMERTYVFNQEPNGGGSKFDIMALLPNLMGGKGVDPGLLALLNQGRNNQDAWGGGMWWIWIILLWFCWGGNGFGGFGNRGGHRRLRAKRQHRHILFQRGHELGSVGYPAEELGRTEPAELPRERDCRVR